MAGIAEEIFRIDSDTQKILKDLQQLSGVYKELTEEQVKQVAELKQLEEAEKRLTAARNKSTNPTQYIKIDNAIKQNKAKIDELRIAVDSLTSANTRAKVQTDALGTSINNAMKGTQVNAVNNQAKSFNNLQTSINQVSREFPAFAVSANTGFLAISNNLPILFDAIDKIKKENIELAKSGEQTKSVLSQIGSAVFSFGSILSIGVTLLTLYGKEVVDWVASLFEGEKELKAVTEANEKYNDSINKTRLAIADLTIKLKVQSGILSKAQGDTLKNENDRRAALLETQKIRSEELKKLKEELGLTDELNLKKVVTAFLSAEAYNAQVIKAQTRYELGLKKINEKHALANQYLNEEYNLRAKVIKGEEDGNDVKIKAVELELLRQKSVADQIKQLQIEAIKDEKERDIELAIFKTQKAFDEIDENNFLEKEKIRIAEINYKQRVEIEKSQTKDRKQLNANLKNLEEEHLKEINKIHAENIPEQEQFALRTALADKLAQELEDIELKHRKKTDEKIAADFKTTIQARKDIARENAEFEIFQEEEKLKRLEALRKLGTKKAIDQIRKEILAKKIALIQAKADEEKAETDNAEKKIEIQNRANIEIAKLKEKEKKEDEARRKQQLISNIQYFADLLKAAIDATQQILALKIKELDTQTSLQEKRVQEAKNIADRGNSITLKLEQERLDALNKQREKYVRQQQALAAIELVANTAIAISKAAAQGGAAAGVTIAAALIALVAGLATARSIAGQAAYREGGYTGDGNPDSESTAIGRRPYIYHKKEFVMNEERTRNYRDIFEDIHNGKVDLREWKQKAHEYDLMQNYKAFMLNPNVMPVQIPMGMDTSGLESKMESVNQSINALSFGLQIDENGYNMRQRKMFDRRAQIRNNAKL